MGAQTFPAPTAQSFSTRPGQSLRGERGKVKGEGEGEGRRILQRPQT